MKRTGWPEAILITALGLSLIVLPLSATAQTTSASKADTLVFSGVFMGFTPDPLLTRNTAKPFMELIFDYLVGKTDHTGLSRDTGIAENWEISPDVKTHTFYLRKGIKFHNGDELTAEDVKFSIDRVTSKESTSGYAAPLRDYIQRVEVVNPYKVVIRTKDPAPDLAYYLSAVMGTEGCIVPKAYIEKNGNAAFVKNPIGSGPYKVKEIVMGNRMTLESVGRHWRIGVPKYNTIVLRHVKEESTRIAQLKTGETDITEVSRDRANEVKKAGYNMFVKEGSNTLVMHYYEMWDKSSPLSDIRVREALELAVNKKEIAEALFAGQAVPWPAGYQGPPDPTWDEKMFPLRPYDPERARRLISQVGGTPRLRLYSYPRPGAPEIGSLAEALAGYWGKVGIKTEIVQLDYDSFRLKWVQGAKTYKPAAGGGGVGALSIHALDSRFWYFATDYKIFHSGETLDMLRLPEADKLMDEVQNEANWEKKLKLTQKWHKYKYDNFLTMGIVGTGQIYATSKKIGKWEFTKDEYAIGWNSLISSK